MNRKQSTKQNYGAAERCRTGSATCNYSKAGLRKINDALRDGRGTTNDNEE